MVSLCDSVMTFLIPYLETLGACHLARLKCMNLFDKEGIESCYCC